MGQPSSRLAAEATAARLAQTAWQRARHSPWRPWDLLVALLALVSVYASITNQLRFGPRLLLPAIMVGLLVAVEIAHRRDRPETARRLTFAVAAIGTLAVQSSVIVLVIRLMSGAMPAQYLLRDAALLWVANVIIFGLWYWELDGGGPRHRRDYGYRPTDLAFPQTTMRKSFARRWSPNFIDYLFVAFNTSTSFSPADTSVLSVRVKLLMMVQAVDSIVLLAVVAARAINILK